ncbi:MAG: hypothetical protein JF606_14770 [Burkholderiales bacterium]|nr:hypothetical protein [Burkholderiales bacterium]
MTPAPLGLKRRTISPSPSVPATRISLSEKTRNTTRAEALARPLERVPDVRPIAQPKSLETIAGECGVPVAALEERIQDELKSFCDEAATGDTPSYSKHRALIDTLYNLFLQSNDNQCPQWIRNTRDFDSFITHFFPQSNNNSQSMLIKHIREFFRDHLPPMLRLTRDKVTTIYNGSRSWVKFPFPETLVDMEVVEEARQLVNEGFTEKEDLFVHGTGSAAMANFAKNQAIWSASLAIQSGDKVVTGEYVSEISHDGQTSATEGMSGLTDIYTSRAGLSSTGYTLRRWFDETPVTFGISEEKQRAYNKDRNICRSYYNSQEGLTVGPIVPLENVVAISAPKASEAQIRSWIAAHCPHAKFVSYEAATILESDNLLGLLRG